MTYIPLSRLGDVDPPTSPFSSPGLRKRGPVRSTTYSLLFPTHSLFSLIIKHHLHTLKPNQTNKQPNSFIMETVKNAANYVAETVQGKGAEASKEANKVSNTLQWQR